jgi:hypothetical protein
MAKYVAHFYGKSIDVYRSLSPKVKAELAKMPFATDAWNTETTTKEQREYLNRWSKLDLRSMANGRDKLPPLSDCAIARETLGDLYTSIYAQFSSVAHYDMYSMNILGLHPAPDGAPVLAADPSFPAVINLHNSLFDLIQCFEAVRRFLNADFDARFSSLLDDWRVYMRRVFATPGPIRFV